MKSNRLAFVLLVGGLACVVIAALYASGTLQLFASTSGPHYKHALLFGALALAAFIAANFSRERVY